ncbi:MAG: repair protein RadA, partial [Pseudomonadota bacterium]
MAKEKLAFVCQACGQAFAKWQGQCDGCGSWNTLESGLGGGRAASGFAPSAGIQRLSDVQLSEQARWSMGLDEFDRVLGGGMVPGGVVLLGGDHGIGKDSWLLPFFSAIGEENVQTIGSKELLRPYESFLKGTKVLHLNEILLGDHKDRKMVNDKLKLFLASPPNRILIEEKWAKPFYVPNLVQFIGCTNHYYCIAPDEGERRYAAFWCRAENPKDSLQAGPWAAWFRQYHQWLEAGGHE